MTLIEQLNRDAEKLAMMKLAGHELRNVNPIPDRLQELLDEAALNKFRRLHPEATDEDLDKWMHNGVRSIDYLNDSELPKMEDVKALGWLDNPLNSEQTHLYKTSALIISRLNRDAEKLAMMKLAGHELRNVNPIPDRLQELLDEAALNKFRRLHPEATDEDLDKWMHNGVRSIDYLNDSELPKMEDVKALGWLDNPLNSEQTHLYKTSALIISRLNRDAEKLAMMKLAGLYDYSSDLVIKRAAITEKDLENWEKLTTQQKNDIIDKMKPGDYLQLPGKALGHGDEGVAYKAISKDFGHVTDEKDFNTVIKRFYGFGGEEPWLEASMKDRFSRERVQQKYPDIFEAWESGDHEKAIRMFNARKKPAKAESDKNIIFNNPANKDILARTLKSKQPMQYENIGAGLKGSTKHQGEIVMEALDVPENHHFSKSEFLRMNREFANRLDKASVGSKPAYGTNFNKEKPYMNNIPVNGKRGLYMRFSPTLMGTDGVKYTVDDFRNNYDDKIQRGMREPSFHNLGIDHGGKIRIFDFGAKPAKDE